MYRAFFPGLENIGKSLVPEFLIYEYFFNAIFSTRSRIRLGIGKGVINT